MAQTKLDPEKNMLAQLNDRFEAWGEKHLPAWLYKLLTLQFVAPGTPEERRQTKRFTEALIVLAFILLIVSIIWGAPQM